MIEFIFASVLVVVPPIMTMMTAATPLVFAATGELILSLIHI